MSAMGNFSEALASILGGLLAVISLRAPIYASIVPYIFAVGVAFTLKEPYRHKKLDTSEGTWKNIFKIVKYAAHEHKEVKWLILYSAFIGASTLTLVWFVQPYMELVGVPLALFGLAWAAFNASVGIFSWYAHETEEFLGRKKSLVIRFYCETGLAGTCFQACGIHGYIDGRITLFGDGRTVNGSADPGYRLVEDQTCGVEIGITLSTDLAAVGNSDRYRTVSAFLLWQ